MSFWDGLTRIAQGKPVFVDTDTKQDGSVKDEVPQRSEVSDPATDQDGHKVIPKI